MAAGPGVAASPGLAARVALRMIGGYQRFLSPWLGNRCRFLPTCSAFAAEAIGRFGLMRGGWLALRRISRCHPLGGSGYDPVPGGEEPRNPGA